MQKDVCEERLFAHNEDYVQNPKTMYKTPSELASS